MIINSLHVRRIGRDAEICFRTSDVREVQSILGKYSSNELWTAEIQKQEPKRSLDANAYCWVLCSEIAKELAKDGGHWTKEDIYREAVKNYGVSCIIPVPKESLYFVCQRHCIGSTGNMVEELNDCRVEINGEMCRCVNVAFYFGSSTYNTQQMARLVDGLVQDAKDVGVFVKSEEEIGRIKREWEAADS